MVKISSIIIGFFVFTLFAVGLFSIAGEVGSNYGSNDHTVYSELSGEYDELFSREGRDDNSTLRRIKNQTDSAVLDATLGGVEAAVKGGKLLTGSFDMTERAVSKAQADSGGLIPGIIVDGLQAILITVTILGILYFFWRARAEV